MTPARRLWLVERAIVTGLLLLAALLRLYRPQDYPAGYHNDEVALSYAVESAAAGRLAVYFPEDTGHEALYMYWSALFARVLGPTAFALRLSSAFLAMIGLCAGWALARRMFGPLAAGVALAALSVTWWNLVLSRITLHVIAVAPTLTLSLYFFWRGLFGASRSTAYLILAGAFCGLAFNSYTAARIAPGLLLLLVAYLALVRRDVVRRQWRGLVAMFAAMLVLCAPLTAYLLTHPGAKQLSYTGFAVDQPITDLLAGNPQLIAETTLQTLGMFGVTSDPLEYFALSGRSLLEPIGATLFWIGLAVALWRWREPRYGIALLSLIAMLTPGMLSQPAPNYAHTVGAMTFAFVMPGIAVSVLAQRAKIKWGQRMRRPFAALLSLLLLGNLIWTVRDFFVVWPAQPGTRWWMQTGLKEVAEAVEAGWPRQPVAVCVASHLIDENIEWWRPAWMAYHYLAPHTEANLRWYDCAEAMVIPSGESPRLAFPDVASLDQLSPWPLPHWAFASRVTGQTVSGQSLIVSANLRPAWADDVARLNSAPVAWPPETGPRPAPTLPIDFGRAMQLTAYAVHPGGIVAPGSSITVTTYWQVTAPLEPRLVLFTHVLTGTQVMAQADRLAVTSHSLQPGDVLAQTHVIELPNLPAGWYPLAIGLYPRDTGARLQVYDGAQPVDDRLFLSPLRIERR